MGRGGGGGGGGTNPVGGGLGGLNKKEEGFFFVLSFLGPENVSKVGANFFCNFLEKKCFF